MVVSFRPFLPNGKLSNIFQVHIQRRLQRYVGRFQRSRLGLGGFSWTAGRRETIDHQRLCAHQSLLVVGCDARSGFTSKSPPRVGFPEDHERRDQVHEAVAGERGNGTTGTTE